MASTRAVTRQAAAPQFAPGERFLTVGNVAQYFGVTEVTIKNWVDAGQLLAARTVGGHRRIAASSVVQLLESQGRPVPAALARRKPVVVLLSGDAAFSKVVRRALGVRVRVEAADDVFAGLLLAARVRPDAIVVDLQLGADARRLLAAVRSDAQTKSADVVAVGSAPGDAKTVAAVGPSQPTGRGNGSLSFVRRNDVPAVVDAVLLKVERPPTLSRTRRR